MKVLKMVNYSIITGPVYELVEMQPTEVLQRTTQSKLSYTQKRQEMQRLRQKTK